MQLSLFTLVLIVYVILIGRMVYKIVIDYDNSNPIKTVAWLFVVVFIPGLGLLAYFLVGRNLTKKRGYFQRLSNELRKNGYFSYGFRPQKIDDKICHTYRYQITLLRNLYPLPLFSGNKVDFFHNGKDKFTCLFEDIENAKEHIHILYYTIGDDKIGKSFKDLLIRKHKEGVEVRLMYDDMGCNQTPNKYFRELEEEGIKIVTFNPINFHHFLHTINYRNHKKIVVIDGHIAYTGGINVKDEYIDGLTWGGWTDVHLRIQGPAAQGLQTVFFIDWFYECNEYLFLEKYYPEIESAGDSVIQVVTAEPIDVYNNIMQGMMEAILRAKRSVYIETPYFVPGESILSAIRGASLSGIDVHIVLPKRSDNVKVQYAANSYVKELLLANVKVYKYLPGFIHSKLIVVDNELTIAGSSNMDIRSFELNFETNVFIYNEETAKKAMEIIRRDIRNSELVILEEWEKRPPHVQFTESVFRLFSPLL